MKEPKMSTLNIDSKVYKKVTAFADKQQRPIRYPAEEILEAGILVLNPIFEELREQREQVERISILEKQLWEQVERISTLEYQVRYLTEKISA
ncbi:MAG TPA: hypothetical protein VGR43_02575 [Dehalococcoidia bacterium]|nr:hypothetical protein [Dehalococcoidia bacterium]